MLFIEDIPELIIDILYIIRNDGHMDIEFVVTIILTLMHILRMGTELGYDIYNYQKRFKRTRKWDSILGSKMIDFEIIRSGNFA